MKCNFDIRHISIIGLLIAVVLLNIIKCYTCCAFSVAKYIQHFQNKKTTWLFRSTITIHVFCCNIDIRQDFLLNCPFSINKMTGLQMAFHIMLTYSIRLIQSFNACEEGLFPACEQQVKLWCVSDVSHYNKKCTICYLNDYEETHFSQKIIMDIVCYKFTW